MGRPLSRMRSLISCAQGNAGVQRLFYNGQIAVRRLPAGLFQLFVDVVVRTADEYAALLQPQALGQGEVLLRGAYPARDLRELIAQLLAAAQCLAVALAVEEKLRLADDALRPAQAVQHLEQLHDLPGLIGRAALLPVAEGGVRYPDVLRHVRGREPEVEGALGRLGIGEHVPIEVALLPVLQLILVFTLHEDVFFAVELYHGERSFPGYWL